MANAQPPEYRTADEVLERARALFGRANQELERGIGVTVDDDHMSRLYRAQTFALVARAGAELAEAMLLAEDADLGQIITSPGPSKELLAALRARADRDGTDAG
jgi:predicted kinase